MVSHALVSPFAASETNPTARALPRHSVGLVAPETSPTLRAPMTIPELALSPVLSSDTAAGTGLPPQSRPLDEFSKLMKPGSSAHALSGSAEAGAPPTTVDARGFYKRFRILVIGRANAGKTTLLRRLCGATDTEMPLIYDERGWKV